MTRRLSPVPMPPQFGAPAVAVFRCRSVSESEVVFESGNVVAVFHLGPGAHFGGRPALTPGRRYALCLEDAPE